MIDHDLGQKSDRVLKNTPLAGLHEQLGAQMVPFADYLMPVQYSDGIIADLMVTNVGDHLFLVVNASHRDIDLACLLRALGGHEIEELERALFALQGPLASRITARFPPEAEDLPFMAAAPFVVDGIPLAVTRCGQAGGDGFEIAVPATGAEWLARALLAEQSVRPADLGARDTLRLEAGLGNDNYETTTPIEAGLVWNIGRRRCEEGGFPGAKPILTQLSDGPRRTLVGLIPEGWAVARAPAEIRNDTGTVIGKVTSGGFGATIGGPVAMGYVDAANAAPGTLIAVIVCDKPIAAQIVTLPFVPHNYCTS